MESLKSESLADEIDDFVYAINYDSNQLLYLNRMARETFPDIQIGNFCYHVFFNLDKPCLDCPMKQLQKSNKSVTAIRFVERVKKWFQIEYNNLLMNDGRQACILTGVDVTTLQNPRFYLERVLDNIRAAAYTIRVHDYKIQSVNQELKRMLPSIQVGDLCYQAIWDKDAPCDFCPLNANCENESSTNMERYNAKLEKYLSIDMVNIIDNEGIRLAVFTGYDITRLVESEKSLKQMAYLDVLTGLRSRIAFMEDLSSLFHGSDQGCIGVLNIKHLKRYNLFFGKKEGDDLLQKVASFCASVYNRNKVYRIDGAKIAFLADGPDEILRLKKIMEETCTSFLNQWENQNFNLFFDTVMVLFPEFAKTPEQALYQAEYLLKKHSQTNKTNILVFDKTEQNMLDRKNKIESIFQKETFQNTFFVYYQPIYDIKTGTYSKCEALLRLYDKEMGFVSPLEFIPLAENNGYIGEIGKFVLEEVCKFLSDRMKANLFLPRVNVNISPIQFARKSFCEEVISIVKQYGVSPSLIQLEVTESIFINSIEYVVDIMNQLIHHGFSFAIDDFGTGYSSLNHIGTMPVECLKLDKSFMDMLLDSKVYQLIVTSVIEITKALKLSIVAEGIESEKQFELIKKLGSDYIQGFLFAKPLPREEFEAFLKANEFSGNMHDQLHLQ